MPRAATSAAAGTRRSSPRRRSFANYLIASPECHEAFVEQLFHHLAKQPVRAFGNEFLTSGPRRFAVVSSNPQAAGSI